MGHVSRNDVYDDIEVIRTLNRNQIIRYHFDSPELFLQQFSFCQTRPEQYASLLRSSAAQAPRQRPILGAVERSQRAKHGRGANDLHVDEIVQCDRIMYLPGGLPAKIQVQSNAITQSRYNVHDTKSIKVKIPIQKRVAGIAKPSSAPYWFTKEAKKVKKPAIAQELANNYELVSTSGDVHVDAEPNTQGLNNVNEAKAKKCERLMQATRQRNSNYATYSSKYCPADNFLSLLIPPCPPDSTSDNQQQ